MELEQLRIFCTVAACRSFTRAAGQLFVSHSTTSRAVSALERELGVPLLVRDRQVYMDSVTKVYNRRYYDERLKNLEGWFSFAMIDMDNFKHINDRFGHQAGDAALYRAAQAIKSQIRSDDELVRYGAMNSSCCSATCRSRSWRRNCSPSAPRLTRSSSRSILNRTSARASAARSRRDAS